MSATSLNAMNTLSTPVRRMVAAAILLCAVFTLPSAGRAAAAAGAPRAEATGISGENARVNGTQLISCATLFPGDVIQLGAGSTVALRFGNDFLLAAPGTEFAIEGHGVLLRSGRIQIRFSGENPFEIDAPFFTVNLAATDRAPGAAEIRLAGAQARVSSVAGRADLMAGGTATPYHLYAGDAAEVHSRAQEPTVPAAGQITRLLPKVRVVRGSLQWNAAATTPVYWNDELRSGPTGRARVELLDGSLLNLGSDSALRIVQHDAQAQQTALELAVGRMRGRVLKLSRPGAKFEIHTPAGVAGLVGTDFYLFATPDFTELIVFEGAVRFTALAGGQISTVTSGMRLVISRNGSVAGPSPTTPQQMQQAIDSTHIPEAAAPVAQSSSGARGAPPAGAHTSVAPIVVAVIGGGAVAGIIIAVTHHGQVSPSRP